MVFFVFGCSRRRGLARRQTVLLQGHDGCLRCGFQPVQVVETRTTCHWCFIPLIPISSSHVVVCTQCRNQAVLDEHISQSQAANRSSGDATSSDGIPVATMVQIVQCDDNEAVSPMKELTKSDDMESPTGQSSLIEAHSTEENTENVPFVETTKGTMV